MELKVDQFGNGMPPLEISNTVVGTIVYPPGGRYGPRLQSDLQLVLLHTGTMRVQVDETVHTVPPGTVTLLKPGHVEEFAFARDTETWHRWIAITPITLDPKCQVWFEALPLSVSLTEEFHQLTDVMLALYNAASSGNACPWHRDTLNALAISALGMFIAESQQNQHIEATHPAVWTAKSFIRKKYHEDVHLTDIAREAHITPEHLVRLFRKSEDTTPMEYLWAYRVQRGLSLLRDTGLTVGDIAERSGFKTSHHFTRTIKRYTGMTPTEIRSRSWFRKR